VASRPDEELILFFYGEHEAPQDVERDVATDGDLSRRYDALRRELSALDGLDAPEPRAGLEIRMWARLAPAVTRRPGILRLPAGWLGWAALATGALVLALGGFLAGRIFHPAPTENSVASNLQALPPAARERVLEAALADHLDASQRLMLEVANGSASIDDERVWAETLLSANRLYRRAAERAGQRRVASVLAEIEPLLAQLADAPGTFDLGVARAQIAKQDLLFKVRVTRNNLKELS